MIKVTYIKTGNKFRVSVVISKRAKRKLLEKSNTTQSMSKTD